MTNLMADLISSAQDALHNLPKISAERAIAEAITLDLMDLDEASF